MGGKVLSNFMNCFPGSISRSADDIVVSLKNQGTAAIEPGEPVFLSADGKGVTKTQTDSAFSRFVGIAVRIPSATPNVYGEDVRKYEANDPVDVIVRGSVVVKLENEMADAGGAVHLTLADGTFTTEAVTDETIQLANCSWRRSAELGDGCAEVVIRERNIL